MATLMLMESFLPPDFSHLLASLLLLAFLVLLASLLLLALLILLVFFAVASVHAVASVFDVDFGTTAAYVSAVVNDQ